MAKVMQAATANQPRQKTSTMRALVLLFKHDPRLRFVFKAMAREIALAKQPQPGMVYTHVRIIDEMKLRMTGEVSAARERDAALVRCAALERRIADLEGEVAALATPTGLDSIPIKVAVREGRKIDPNLSEHIVRRLYSDGKIIGRQNGKGKRISICRNSLKRYLMADRRKG